MKLLKSFGHNLRECVGECTDEDEPTCDSKQMTSHRRHPTTWLELTEICMGNAAIATTRSFAARWIVHSPFECSWWVGVPAMLPSGALVKKIIQLWNEKSETVRWDELPTYYITFYFILWICGIVINNNNNPTIHMAWMSLTLHRERIK